MSVRANGSIGDVFNRAVAAFRENAGMAIILSLLYLVLLSAAGGSTMGLASLLLYGPLTAGYCNAMLRLLRREPFDFAHVLKPLQDNPGQVILMGVILNIFYAIGFLLCIIPGLVVAVLYMPAFFFLVDKRSTAAWDAMEASRKAVTADLGKWILLGVVALALNLAGALLCGIGLVVTFPVTMFMIAAAYDDLWHEDVASRLDEDVAPEM